MSSRSENIAIIGMSGRFPGARNVREFWRNLRDGVESISFFSDEELKASGISEALYRRPDYVRARAVLDDIEMFDAAFFGYNPREAEFMDPQHRIFLECAWEALEDAGYDSDLYQGSIGVFAGAGPNYYLLNIFSSPAHVEGAGNFLMQIANRGDYVPTRVSYKLNLTGPSINIQTACSTSLVAVHVACQSLLHGECDMALAGGVAINVPQKLGYVYQEGAVSSPDGHCRAFDAKAQGTVGGNGVGIVVLKRAEEAISDGDNILAIISGSAVNNDGANKAGFTAPSVRGQAEVIAEAHAIAGVSPETITYVEAHGTATPLGDPIEINALTRAFRAGTQKRGFCGIGSVKSNIGHVDTAAGVAGLIKAVLALRHRQIPPSLHFVQPNPQLDLDNSPFYVNSKLIEWKSSGTPLRAGVSSFGIGGTNAHVILEEAPARNTPGPSRSHQLLVLSARTRSALENATHNLVEHLKQHTEHSLADVAYTLLVGRRAFAHRRVAVARDVEEAVVALETRDPQHVRSGQTSEREPRVIMMFPGQGSQYVNMGRGLYESELQFRRHVDECSEILRPHLGIDLRDLIYPRTMSDEESARRLTETRMAQPALFVIETALARQLLSWRIQPHALIGHSVGEYTAAYLAGVLSLEDALSLVAERGRLMNSIPEGAMLAVHLSPEELLPRLSGELSLAAVNAPKLCVASGPAGAVKELKQQLDREGIEARPLHTSIAGHSAMMEPVLAPFAERVGAVKLEKPKIPFISNTTGSWVDERAATDPAYWVCHIRHAVRFADGIRELKKIDNSLFLEVGPGQALSTFVRQSKAPSETNAVVSTMRKPNEAGDDLYFLLNAIGRLWIAGVKADWSALYALERRRRISLPPYPFSRKRYWIERRFATRQDAAVLISSTESSTVEDDFQDESPDYVAPRNSAEQAIASIWQELLGIPQIGATDNFYELGGHSLLATQVAARINDVFEIKVPLNLLFEKPTVAELALAVEDLVIQDLDQLTEEEAEELLQVP